MSNRIPPHNTGPENKAGFKARYWIFGMSWVLVTSALLGIAVLVVFVLQFANPTALLPGLRAEPWNVYEQATAASYFMIKGKIVAVIVLLPWLIIAPVLGTFGIRFLYRTGMSAAANPTAAAGPSVNESVRREVKGWSVLVSGILATGYFLLAGYGALIQCLGVTGECHNAFLPQAALSLLVSVGIVALAILAGRLIGGSLLDIASGARPLPGLLIVSGVMVLGLLLTLPLMVSATQIFFPDDSLNVSFLIPKLGPSDDPTLPRLVYYKPEVRAFRSNDLYLGRMDGTQERRIAEKVQSFAVSPDGRQLAFSSLCEMISTCLQVANVDGTDARTVAKANVTAWSPDGCQILGYTSIAGDFDGFVIKRDGTSYQGVPTLFGYWMPDSKAVVGYGKGIWQFELDTEQRKTVTEKLPTIWQLSPEGKRIAYTNFPDDNMLFILDLETGTELSIAPADAMDWSPDGKQLLLQLDAADGRLSTIQVVNADGSGLVTLPIRGTQPRWSPDGTWIAYVEVVDDKPMISVARADGTKARQLYRGVRPVWVPPAREIPCT